MSKKEKSDFVEDLDDVTVEKSVVAEQEALRETAEAPARKSRFAELYDEAMADHVETTPYKFDFDPENPIYIPKPETTDQVLELASIIDADGDVKLDEVKPMLRAFLGSRYYKLVYENILAHYPLAVTLSVINDMNQHWFGKELTEQAKRLPGGTAGSSS